ncbi:hypothetical protein Tel_00590 [Candidatus Tenderia electrophaga]|jgi:protein SCO1/2|uniref:Thioredoxin domain-containing protein n=1 Tax=Candidatus Tenderia electrophaga TaxID=1748243 RepID=A0A0S2T9B5_9GAMM|nr:hypothetical protein Tel_00590 [Candidatus Tenderia electrophaga]
MIPLYPYCRLFLLLLTCLSYPTLGSAQTPLKVHDKWGGEFTLTDQHGQALSLSDYAGKVVLLSFGYTHCPDICPTTLFTLKRLVHALDEDGERVQVLFITLDPARDTPERLREYMAYFDPGFVGLSGSMAETRQVAEQYGTRFEKEAGETAGEYSLAHTAIIYLIDPQGRIRAFYKLNAPLQTLAVDVRRLLAGE